MIKKYTTIALCSLLFVQNIGAETSSCQPKAAQTTVKQKPSVTKKIMTTATYGLASLGACWLVHTTLCNQKYSTERAFRYYKNFDTYDVKRYVIDSTQRALILLGCHAMLAKYPRKAWNTYKTITKNEIIEIPTSIMNKIKTWTANIFKEQEDQTDNDQMTNLGVFFSPL